MADRGASALDRDFAAFDGLTGVYLRQTGLDLLTHAVERSRRARAPLVVAFVDVDHLRLVNDTRSHAAGDALLVEVARTLRAELRSYDLVLRYGGDECGCAVSGLSLGPVATRFVLLGIALGHGEHPGSVTVGLAELQDGDSAHDVVARADAALYDQCTARDVR